MGIDILEIDILGVDILGIDILALPRKTKGDTFHEDGAATNGFQFYPFGV